jgi:hypothetical protein
MVICTAYKKHNSFVSTTFVQNIFCTNKSCSKCMCLYVTCPLLVSNFKHNENMLINFSNITNIIQIISILIFMQI